jgi:hypothetical protein
MSTPPKLRYREKAAKKCGYKPISFKNRLNNANCGQCTHSQNTFERRMCNNLESMYGFAVSKKKICKNFKSKNERLL